MAIKYIKASDYTNILVNDEVKQITLNDERYYLIDDVFYPSVTYILQYFPKNKFFEDWLKNVGRNSDIILERAGEEGSALHDIIDRIIKGETVRLLDDSFNLKYPINVWNMAIRFLDFYKSSNMKVLKNEIVIFSKKYVYAGTVDLVCEINGERWIIDLKTSNSVHDSYFLQIAAYKNAWEEIYGEKIDKIGILWLKASTRTKIGFKQGEGWKLIEADDFERYFDMFLTVYKLYFYNNPNVKPSILNYPIELKI
ncbi:MAG: hypothetical protein IRZ03_13155 [Acidobacterium ailaaui]|nr:hypothetical protein [Pseudacidobacterium ailaaui]